MPLGVRLWRFKCSIQAQSLSLSSPLFLFLLNEDPDINLLALFLTLYLLVCHHASQ